MRPVTKNGSGSYQPTAKLSFDETTAKLLGKLGVPYPDNPERTAVLALLDRIAEKVAKGTKPSADEKAVTSAVMKKIGPIYRQAGPVLWQRIGPFCSYCETPLTGQFDVEHAMAKSQFPTRATDWENFLAACTACNSKKGDDPKRAYVRDQLAKANPTVTDYWNWVRRDHYDWPDRDASTYRDLPNVVSYSPAPGKAIRGLLPADAADSRNVLVGVDVAERDVLGDIWDSTVKTPNKLQKNAIAWVIPKAKTTAATDMVTLCGLNVEGATVTDRRIVNRTVAWFTAVRAIAVVDGAKSSADFELRFAALVDLAMHSGYFSMWVPLLLQRTAKYAPYNGQTYAAVLLDWPTFATAFPGTDKTEIP